MGTGNHGWPSVVMAAAASVVLLASGCAGTVGEDSASGGGSSFEYGSSLEETRAAFEDVERVTLRFQTGAASPDGPLGETYVDFADRVSEWSDGKVTIDLTWAGSIAPLTEVDDALADGRLDLGQLSFTYQPKEFPVTNNMNDASVEGAVPPVSGDVARSLSVLEASIGTPEVYEEFGDVGITPLLPIAMFGETGMACSEPVTSPQDLKGRQVVSNSTVQSQQVEELGAVPTSIEYTELYEGFQRGIVDCVLAVPSVYSGMALPEVAPHFYYGEGANFQAGPTSILAGSSWESLPLPVRQLVYDQVYEWLGDSTHANLRYIDAANQALAGTDGEIAVFDQRISTALGEANESIVAEQSASDLYDAAAFDERAAAALRHWQEQAQAATFADEGTYADLGEWYQGDLGSSSAEDVDAFYAEAFDKAASAARPE